jgi:hypothetical protein
VRFFQNSASSATALFPCVEDSKRLTEISVKKIFKGNDGLPLETCSGDVGGGGCSGFESVQTFLKNQCLKYRRVKSRSDHLRSGCLI